MDYEKFNYLNEKVFFVLDGKKHSFAEMYDRVRDHYLARIFRVKNFQKKAQISREETKALDGLFEIAESALVKGKYITENGEIECYRIEN
jgi:very-short-patch-repair endonuclease